MNGKHPLFGRLGFSDRDERLDGTTPEAPHLQYVQAPIWFCSVYSNCKVRHAWN